jgi:hypothetical protein
VARLQLADQEVTVAAARRLQQNQQSALTPY